MPSQTRPKPRLATSGTAAATPSTNTNTATSSSTAKVPTTGTKQAMTASTTTQRSTSTDSVISKSLPAACPTVKKAIPSSATTPQRSMSIRTAAPTQTPTPQPPRCKPHNLTEARNSETVVAALRLDNPVLASALANPKLQSLLTGPPHYPHVHLPSADPNNIALVIPTPDYREFDAISTRAQAYFAAAQRRAGPNSRMAKAKLFPIRDYGVSCLGDQAYDGAGAYGAHRRAVDSLRNLTASESDLIRAKGLGTFVVVGAQGFVMRPAHEGGRPVDYTYFAACRVSMADMTGKRPGGWVWKRAVSKGVTVPDEALVEAEKLGFRDEGKTWGQYSVGSRLEHELFPPTPGVGRREYDGEDWQKYFAGKSRYTLFEEVMGREGSFLGLLELK